MVIAIGVTKRMCVDSILRLALSVEFVELRVVAGMGLAAMLNDPQSTNHSVVLGEVPPIVMWQHVPNLEWNYKRMVKKKELCERNEEAIRIQRPVKQEQIGNFMGE
jgi:hypothetical protein